MLSDSKFHDSAHDVASIIVAPLGAVDEASPW